MHKDALCCQYCARTFRPQKTNQMQMANKIGFSLQNEMSLNFLLFVARLFKIEDSRAHTYTQLSMNIILRNKLHDLFNLFASHKMHFVRSRKQTIEKETEEKRMVAWYWS